MKNTLLLLISLFSLGTSLWGAIQFCEGHEFSVAPEALYFRRSKETGSQMKGALLGVSAYYQRWVPCGIYYRAEGHYWSGESRGNSSSGQALESNYHETWYAGAVGWSWKLDYCRPISCVPYVLYGHSETSNHFKEPTPLLVEMKNQHNNAGIGLQFRVPLTQSWTFGLDGRMMATWNGENKIVDDPLHGTITLQVDERYHYKLSLPVSYTVFWDCIDWNLEATPYYWYRSFGSLENVPEDYISTKFRMYGVQCGFVGRF